MKTRAEIFVKQEPSLGYFAGDEAALEEYAGYIFVEQPEFWEQLTAEPVFDSEMVKGTTEDYLKCLQLAKEDILLQLKAQNRKNALLDKEVANLKKELVRRQRSTLYLQAQVETLRKNRECKVVLEYDEEKAKKKMVTDTPTELESSFNVNEYATKESGAVPPKEGVAAESSKVSPP
ncbi:hypothetical protein M5689_002142 [Euphorbia peplus]|nr:hypothetical protein M5689_002141 [Euphorbia peplus]WCJ19868.1 hypothetical protein M5689_002142 [Euphorbia peplus]